MVSKFELSPHVAKCGRRPRPKFANVLTIDAMCDCAQCCMHALFLKYLYAISVTATATATATRIHEIHTRNTRSAWILEWKQLYIKLLHAWCAHLVLGNRKEINRNIALCARRITASNGIHLMWSTKLEICRQMHRFCSQMPVADCIFWLANHLWCWPTMSNIQH